MLMPGFGERDCYGEDWAGRVELHPVALISRVQRQSPHLLTQVWNETAFAWNKCGIWRKLCSLCCCRQNLGSHKLINLVKRKCCIYFCIYILHFLQGNPIKIVGFRWIFCYQPWRCQFGKIYVWSKNAAINDKSVSKNDINVRNRK